MNFDVLLYDCETQSEQRKAVIIMPKLAKLKGRIKEKNQSYASLSKAIGISVSALNNKINGRSSFDIIEASRLSSILDISPEEVINFFT